MWLFLSANPLDSLCEILMDHPSQSSCVNVEKTIPSALMLYLKLVPTESFARLLQGLKLRRHRCVFTLPVVIWLMMFQRLHDKGTLSVAVQQVICGLPAPLIPRPCKRLRKRDVSSHTGGYNQARQKLPLKVVQKVSDEIFEQLTATKPQMASALGVRMFVLDGSTLLMPHTPSLCQAYPPSRNQYGESHWPIMRVLVAHDLHCAVASQPHWGPVNGPEAVSEQRLTEEMLRRLPAQAGIMGDQNFGVFSVAWAAQQQNHPVLLRLTPARAKGAFGSVLCSGTDRSVQWQPSRCDRTRHAGLPLDASAHGRLIVQNVYPSDGSGPLKLYLFTTLDLAADVLVQLYGLRWNVETDLRTIKKMIRLEMLQCQTPEMVAKELILAIMAYNLVRAVIDQSAQRTQMNPRNYSFSRVQDVLNAWLPRIAGMTSEVERQAAHELMMKCVAQCKLYKRKKPASYPRAIWERHRTFLRHSSPKLPPKAERS
jgi:hypothetical protein